MILAISDFLSASFDSVSGQKSVVLTAMLQHLASMGCSSIATVLDSQITLVLKYAVEAQLLLILIYQICKLVCV